MDEETVRFFGRLDKPLLRMVSMGLSLRKAALPSDWDTQSIARCRNGNIYMRNGGLRVGASVSEAVPESGRRREQSRRLPVLYHLAGSS